MEDEKITEGQFMDAVKKMVNQCYQALAPLTLKDKADMPEEKKSQYIEMYLELEDTLERLDNFQESYDGPREEENTEEKEIEKIKKLTPVERVLKDVEGILKDYDYAVYFLKNDIKDARLRGVDLRRYNVLMKKYELLVNEWTAWKNEYALKNDEFEQKKAKIADFFEVSEEEFVEFYNKYISYYGKAEDKIWDALDEKLEKYIDEFFSKYSAIQVLRAFPLDGSYKPTDRWCLVGMTMKSSNNPLDLVENKEEFLMEVAQRYLEGTLPADLRSKLEEGLGEGAEEVMPSDEPLSIAETGPAVLPGDVGQFCVDSKTLEPKDEDLEDMEFFELEEDDPVNHKS